MRTVDEQEYQDWKDKNNTPYAAAVFEFAEKWANLIEEKMASGRQLEEVADDCHLLADKEIGTTGFMYSCAVSILARCWIHGERLRRWHNLDVQLGDEGEEANESGGVLNTAMVNLGVRE